MHYGCSKILVTDFANVELKGFGPVRTASIDVTDELEFGIGILNKHGNVRYSIYREPMIEVESGSIRADERVGTKYVKTSMVGLQPGKYFLELFCQSGADCHAIAGIQTPRPPRPWWFLLD